MCFSESCKGNLEGLSGINLKRMHLSLLLFLALLAHWFCSSGTCRLLISPPSPPTHTHPTPHQRATAAQSFCQSSPLKKKKGKENLLYFLRNDPLFLCLWDSESKTSTHRMAHTLWLGFTYLWKCDGPAEARPRSLMVLRVEVKRRGLVVFRLLRVSLLWGLGVLRVKLERTDAVEGRDLVIHRQLVWWKIAGVLMNNSHSVIQRE